MNREGREIGQELELPEGDVESVIDSLDAEEIDGERPQYVVGIGASAGGLEAIEALFDRLPADTGMAFVVVQHLSPDFKSLMDEIVRRHTEMPVFRVTDGMPVRRDAIYLIPAGKEMIVSQGRLLITDKDLTQTLTLPIDHFFRSLAHDCGTRAIAVVLSGSGSDGSRGVREVHTMGGLVITQTASTAAFDSMPNSSNDTGVVDITGSPEEIAQTLLRLSNHPLQRTDHLPDQPVVPEDGIKRILREIRDAYGIDFTYYKPSTVMRRIERRLLLNHSDNLEAYVDRVVNDSEELNLLYKDLLIGVTQFFRDMEPFQLLEERILPELLLKLPVEHEIRIWTAGCATGEEAYSLAMLVHERLLAMNRPVNVRIFATDVHRASLDAASIGLYGEASIGQVSSSRLQRYFVKTQDGYKISQELRNMVVFAPHNLIKDAPFTRLDLISCRNMMIYLQPLAQKKVLSLFHFALKTGGVLFLGPSETTGELTDEFESINAQWRLYRKRRDIRLPLDLRLPIGGGSIVSANRGQTSPPRGSRFPIRSLGQSSSTVDREMMSVYDSLLTDFMPTALLINEDNELVHAFGDVGKILRIPTGRASSNALNMLPADLRTIVVGAIQRVTRTGKPIVYDQVRVDAPNQPRNIRVTVKPVTNPDSNVQYVLVALELDNDPNEAAILGTPLEIDEVSRERIDVLESELRHSRESLHATIEELESSNEELQATNEEMVASNEELQSTNEELHSVNEELYTVNAEYQKKISELTELGHDMNNLLNSTDVHTLFLDEELAIRKFTPQMSQVFNLIPGDVGRRLDGFSHNIPCDDLMDRISSVLNDGLRHEEEIAMPEGGQFLLRILPYRGETNRMGVVLTLLDITESKDAEKRFRATFDNAAVGIAHVKLNGRWLRVNDRLCDILGYKREELLEKTFQDVTFADDIEHDQRQFEALKRGEIDRYSDEKRYVRKDGSLIWISLTVSLQRGDSGEPQYAIPIVQDISQRKLFEEGLTKSIEQRDRFLATLSHELRNPLAAVRHSLAILRHDSAPMETRQAAIQTVGRQAEQMAHLLDDLLDVSRITQEKIRYEMRPHDLRQVVRDAVDAIRPTIIRHRHGLTMRLPDEPVIVNGDESRLMQVIENLLTNACKYTPAEGKIDVTLLQEGEVCRLTISDNGWGIPSELLGTVFDMFMQSDRDLDRRDGGMGLGLTVVKSLVEHHGGRIRATSDGAGCGAQFTVELPVSSLPRTAIPATQSTAEQPTRSLRDKRIVLVEDNDDSREMLVALLELNDFDVIGCRDGRAGLETLVNTLPAVALVDIGLPELDGYEVARRFRKRCPDANVHLIALTGYGQTGDIMRSEDAGFDSHVTKPVDPHELIAILDEALKSTAKALD